MLGRGVVALVALAGVAAQAQASDQAALVLSVATSSTRLVWQLLAVLLEPLTDSFVEANARLSSASVTLAAAFSLPPRSAEDEEEQAGWGGRSAAVASSVSPYASRWASAEETDEPPSSSRGPSFQLAAALPFLQQSADERPLSLLLGRAEQLLRDSSSALRAVSSGFEVDAATGEAAVLVGRRFVPREGGPGVSVTARLPSASAPSLRAEGSGYVAEVAVEGGIRLLRLDLPRMPVLGLGGEAYIRPCWRGGGVLPQLHAAWRSDGPTPPKLLPSFLRGGQSAAWASLLPADGQVRAGCTHERRFRAQSSYLPAAATHALRVTLRSQMGGSGGPEAHATYKLRLSSMASAVRSVKAATVGVSLAPLGGAPAPAIAFVKARVDSGTTLRLFCGLACSLVGAELSIPPPKTVLATLFGGGGGSLETDSRWVARVQMADGKLSMAQLERKLVIL